MFHSCLCKASVLNLSAGRLWRGEKPLYIKAFSDSVVYPGKSKYSQKGKSPHSLTKSPKSLFITFSLNFPIIIIGSFSFTGRDFSSDFSPHFPECSHAIPTQFLFIHQAIPRLFQPVFLLCSSRSSHCFLVYEGLSRAYMSSGENLRRIFGVPIFILLNITLEIRR